MQELSKRTESGVSNYGNDSLFINTHGAFLFKKIEKIAAALYMITEFFSAQEPLKWNIRRVSNAVIKDILILTKKQSALTSRTLRNVHGHLLEISSYVSLGQITGLISNMNFTILKTEIEKVSSDLENEIKRHPDVKETIRTDFFEAAHESVKSNKGQMSYIKDTVKDNVSGNVATKQEEVSISVTPKNQRQNGDRDNLSNDSRRAKVLDVIREKGRVSIKDIIREIPKCSSKTIQRDLVKLIEDGFVLKEGDRRWSIYFLKP